MTGTLDPGGARRTLAGYTLDRMESEQPLCQQSVDADIVTFTCGGRTLKGRSGQSVAAALIANGILSFRNSVEIGEPRGAFCLMGVCQECRVRIDGTVREACLVWLEAGLSVELSSA